MMTNLQQKMIIPLNIMKQRDCSSISQMHQQKIKLSFLVSWSFKVILFMFQQHQLVKDRGTCYNLGLMEISLPSKYRRIFMWHSNLEMGAQYQNAAIIPGLTASDVCAFPPCRGHQHQNSRDQSIIFIFIRAAAPIFANGILPKMYISPAYIRPTLCQNQKGTPYDRYEFIHQRIKQLKLDTFSN